MICPNCQTTNPNGSKFCNECGTKLPAPCPNCGQQNPQGAKFCNECGHRLAENQPSSPSRTPAAPPTQASPPDTPSPSSPIPDERQVVSPTHALEGERRIVTVLFCDVTGSTSTAGQLDPEEWTEIMNGAFEQMIRPIYRYEGTVVRLLGDAVLAFFGAPIAREDDPQRAVLAGLEIQETIQSYRARVQRQWGVDFGVRCGINTGLVVVGAVGSDLHVEYTALGDAVNLAARMEQTAQPGTVQITEETYRLVAPLFDAEELGGIEIKGKDEPVRAYRVLGEKATPGRLRGIEGLEAQLVGRHEELAKLQTSIADLQRGIGGIVLLTGEAGLGKSRLVRELQSATQGAYPHTYWFNTTSLSYEITQPYGQFQRLMRSVCNISEDDPPQTVRQGIEHVLSRKAVEQRDPARQVLEALFGVADQSSGAPRLEGESFKGQLYVTMYDLWREWVTVNPVVLVCDDLHWADPASIELLEHLLAITDKAPILILCAMRPDRQAPGWALKTHAEHHYRHRYSEIKLQPLSTAESDLLINSLLAVADLPARLRQRVLEKAAGNPFFVEEVVRTLIDRGVVVHNQQENRWVAVQNVEDIHIPDNLQSLLMARIDRLDKEVRQTILLAAVIGRSFYFRVLTNIAQRDQSALAQHMRQLQQGELIQEAARLPEPEYIFRHVLVQETAYAMILHRQRRDFHRRVGETLEELFPDRLEENAVVLAYHFDQARHYARALRYCKMAGDAAFRLYSLEEAIGHYDRALELAQRQDIGDLKEPTDLYRHLYVRKGRALELDTQFESALAVYEEMAATGTKLGDQSLELASLIARGTLYSTHTPVADDVLGKTVDEKALALARALGDRQAEAKALWNLMLLHNYQLDAVEEAARYGEESLAIALELDLKEQLAFTQNDLHWVYTRLGDLRRAKALLEESQKRWRELGNLPMLVDSLNGSIIFYAFAGELEQAITTAEEGYQIARSIGNLWNQTSIRGTVATIYRLRGEYGTVTQYLEEAIGFAQEPGMEFHTFFPWTLLALAYGELGMVKRGLELYHQVQRRFEQMTPAFRMADFRFAVEARLHLLDGNLPAAEMAIKAGQVASTDSDLFSLLGYFNPFVMCDVALAAADFDQVRQLVDEFLPIYETTGARWALPEFRYFRAQAMRAQGEIDDARKALTQARAEAEEMGLRRIHWPILAALAELKAEQGDTAVATELRGEAGNILNAMADNLPQGELRTSFLAQPEIRHLVGTMRGKKGPKAKS